MRDAIYLLWLVIIELLPWEVWRGRPSSSSLGRREGTERRTNLPMVRKGLMGHGLLPVRASLGASRVAAPETTNIVMRSPWQGRRVVFRRQHAPSTKGVQNFQLPRHLTLPDSPNGPGCQESGWQFGRASRAASMVNAYLR